MLEDDLGDPAEVGLAGDLRPGLPGEAADASGGGAEQPDDHAAEGRLATAALPDERQNPAPADVERHAIDRPNRRGGEPEPRRQPSREPVVLAHALHAHDGA